MENKVFSGLTVNYHFTQVCNMGCKYCFVSKCRESSKQQQELVIKKLAEIFERINFVGGEPTTSPHLLALVKLAKSYGMKVTLVTNGQKLVKEPEYAELLLSNLDGIGISIDSLNPETNRMIGRTFRNEPLSKEDYLNLCKKIKGYGIPLKINTVVSKANLQENFSDFFEEVQPDRIKMFQVLEPNAPTKQNYSEFLITQNEYEDFVAKHRVNDFKIVAEDNEHMLGSYIMVNSQGCFENNELGLQSKSLMLSEVTIEEAFKEAKVDMHKYMYRYA